MNSGIITVTKTMVTETAHRLIDYQGKCASLHGHSYRWEVTAACDQGLDRRGMVIDFGDLKAAMKKWIYGIYDHATVLAFNDPLLDSAEVHEAADGSEQKLVQFPGNPTAENFAKHTAKMLQMEMDDAGDMDESNYRVTRVRVWETANSYAEWKAEDVFDTVPMPDLGEGEAAAN